ncbi:thiosulfate sulfurtransferase/rhodanese-like domain-containing protein 2 [Eucyclogobius newberryi]|uniref:thiosulfate sulfurtransferase/rhodanese-like domain-containing protein 2 n=1 Tax=Eucyclogobius newberryi TaxID=166745 RepID=UPI003B5CE501
MASDNMSCTEFGDLDLEPDVPNQLESFKKEKHLCATLRKHFSLCRRKSFAAFVASKKKTEGGESWCCCGQTFSEHSAMHKHVARSHQTEVEQRALTAFEKVQSEARAPQAEPQGEPQPGLERADVCSWIPDTSRLSEEQLTQGPGRVLLYYCYCDVLDPHAVCAWQKLLCEKLQLTGKVRVASEGINGTLGGSCAATEVYIHTMCSNSLFRMHQDDFKTSPGGAECFTELKVGVYREIVPMGVDPQVVSYRLAGPHLDPEEFHRELDELLAKDHPSRDTILLDCRNFYESKIGQFTHCLAPNIRKFSYFPDYVEQNLELFREKRVLMYCTGGIRCERASAYLRSKEVCKEVLQLKGGIHKYLEQFPQGHYRGKLFVFDERFAISSNNDVISDCRYCGAPWDHYELCSSVLCRQLVLSCLGCRHEGHTACCPTCQSKDPPLHHREECECTTGRPRIPLDV